MLHLGSRVSALLDGRLSAGEEERAWAHVHACHLCRDLVEREGWIKTSLSGWSGAGASAPDRAKQQLLRSPAPVGGPALAAAATPWRPPFALLAGGALGTAVLGVLALGMAPASAPTPDRRLPVTTIGGVEQGPTLPSGPASTGVPTTRPSTLTTISVKIGE